MAQIIGNTQNIKVGTNSGKIGAANAIQIIGEFNLCMLVVVNVLSLLSDFSWCRYQ